MSTRKNNLSRTIAQNLRDNAMAEGEGIASMFNFIEPPIDLFKILNAEKDNVYSEGGDFGDDFDGCLEFLGPSSTPRYLLAYNTKYNRDESKDKLHPRVRFSIAHELGHYFLDKHRRLLSSRIKKFSCKTELFGTETKRELEFQADYFATGLLMPSSLLGSIVNQCPESDLAKIQQTADLFEVSMTSMMLRWVKLSHFPCGIFSVSPDSIIEWGWVSQSIFDIGAYQRQENMISTDAFRFFNSITSNSYSEGSGKGLLNYWLQTDHSNLSIKEFYVKMRYYQNMLVFIYAYEDEIEELQ